MSDSEIRGLPHGAPHCAIGPRFAFDAMDPDLRDLGDRAPYLQGQDAKADVDGG